MGKISKSEEGEEHAIRRVSDLIPYLVDGEKVRVFLQKREGGIKKHPDCVGLFGGSAEGQEIPKEALKREIKEELDFDAEGARHFRRYEKPDIIKDVFLLEVPNDFESCVKVQEGEYGKWFDEQDVSNEPKFVEEDRKALQDFYESLRAKK